MSRVGWYVHHHGRGHLTRFLAVRPHLPADVAVFSTLAPPALLPERTEWIVLPRDDESWSDAQGRPRDPRDADPSARGALHWAPLGHPGHRRRLAVIAEICNRDPFDVFVVDVSVEVALWVRLLGIATVVFAQPGDRTDEPHELAYRVVDRIVAPWAAGTIPSAALDAARDRVRWVGGISRFDGRPRSAAPERGRVLVLGEVADVSSMERARTAAAASGWSLATAGATELSWQDDPWDALCRSEVVISAGGQNSVADLAAANARAVVIASPRPFDEQAATADVLVDLGLAVGGGGWPDAVGSMLESARALKPDWRRWGSRGAAARAAAAVLEVAG